MKKSELRTLIREEATKLNESWHNLYIANTDTKIGKNSIPKNTVIRAIGGGLYSAINGNMQLRKSDVVGNSNFDEIENDTWTLAIDVAEQVENYGRRLDDLVVKNPGNAKKIISDMNSVLNRISQMVK